MKSVSLLLLLLGASPASGLPQAVPAPQSSPFDKADLNHDGNITRAEFVTARSARFNEIDRNRDGKIDRADFPRAANHRRALEKLDAQIAAADSNHDGSVSRAELDNASTPLFDKVDTNHDGVVTKAEAAAFRQSVAAHRAAG